MISREGHDLAIFTHGAKLTKLLSCLHKIKFMRIWTMAEHARSCIKLWRTEQAFHLLLLLLAFPVVPVVIFTRLSCWVKWLNVWLQFQNLLLESTSDSVYCEVDGLLQSRFLKLWDSISKLEWQFFQKTFFFSNFCIGRRGSCVADWISGPLLSRYQAWRKTLKKDSQTMQYSSKRKGTISILCMVMKRKSIDMRVM